MKATVKVKQVSIQLPEEVVRRATTAARRTTRHDGLKQTATATLRDWLLKGMESANVNASR
jgi:hypothetical protein